MEALRQPVGPLDLTSVQGGCNASAPLSLAFLPACSIVTPHCSSLPLSSLFRLWAGGPSSFSPSFSDLVAQAGSSLPPFGISSPLTDTPETPPRDLKSPAPAADRIFLSQCRREAGTGRSAPSPLCRKPSLQEASLFEP